MSDRCGLSSHRALAALVVSAAVLVAGCGSDLPQSPSAQERRLDPARPETWIEPNPWPGYWTIYADVRDFVGEERWAALDTAWMEERARADLEAATSSDDYADVFMLSGLWRLQMLRSGVLHALAEAEPEADWPLVTPDRTRGHGWRMRIERWRQVQPEGARRGALAAKLDAAWEEAVAAADTRLAARVLESRTTWLDASGASDEVTTAVHDMVRASLRGYLTACADDWRNGRPPAGVIGLMERCGVPDGVDLGTVVAAAQHYECEMADETIPLPHPFELYVRVLRLQRLHDLSGD